MALTDNLISHWNLDEASGNALDAHGGNTLTETGGTIASTTGKVGNARDFEAGDTEYFEIADNTDLSTGDIDFTIAAWVKFETLGNYAIISKWTPTGNQREYELGYTAGGTNRFRFQVSTNGSTTVTLSASTFGAPSTGVWYFLTAWHDATNNQLGIAVNAGTPDTVSHTTGVFNGTSAFAMGARPSAVGDYWDGLIDEVGFWKRVLTSDERTALYNGGAGLAYPFSGGGSAVDRTASSAPSTSDAAVRSLTALRSATSAPSTSDAAARALALPRALAEAPSTSDAAARAVSAVRSAASGPSTSDACASVVVVARSASAAPSTSDTITVAAALFRSASASPSTSDAVVYVTGTPAPEDPIQLFYAVPGPISLTYEVDGEP